ncbi:unnamed protein product [Fraxinus pennsylvanica]|uniref:Uncharacterized protein n=1 Tax=Fraxinus pennsylvanica TaxID=56036 RepID=A0AAD2E7Y3_9LAMI|nr:unnamed protein product [Fraxinus pennsylvanica]
MNLRKARIMRKRNGVVMAKNERERPLPQSGASSDKAKPNGKEIPDNWFLSKGLGKITAEKAEKEPILIESPDENKETSNLQTLLRQKLGVVVESHWHQCTAENSTNSDYRPLSKSLSAVITKSHCSDDEIIEVVLLSQNADSHNTGARLERSVLRENKVANYQNEILTLILFEDTDATLSNNPVLPKSLDRLELNFAVPSLKELFGLVRVLWCQGQSPREEEEIVKSLILMAENHRVVEVLVQEDKINDNKTENTYVKDGEADTIEAKKEAVLRLHSTQDDGECAQIGECFSERISVVSREIFVGINGDT